MKFSNIIIKNKGYVHCKSAFYSCRDVLSSTEYTFTNGINMLNGDIDSGVWAISYLLSMYKHNSQEFILFDEATLTVDGKDMQLDDFLSFSCYMDFLYPLFDTDSSIRTIISDGLEKTQCFATPDDLKELFQLDSERFDRPIKKAGNEYFKAMAAIGCAYNKQVFCFPWLSETRFNYYKRISDLLNTLESLNKVVIFPVGKVNFND